MASALATAKALGGLLYYDSPLLAAVDGLLYRVTTRIGGESEGPRRFLNLSQRLPTDPVAAARNRERVFRAFEIPPGRAVFADQVHGDVVRAVGEDQAGAGCAFPDPGILGTDALVTDRPGLYLVGLSADCPIVAFVDPRRRAVGVAHSGRKGTVLDIAGATVRALARHHGSRPADLLAVVGPSIGPCCYEIGPEVAREVRRALPAADAFLPVRVSRQYLDLATALRTQLRRAGLDPARIEVSPICTACRTDHFYSYRAEGKRTGRFGTIVGFRE